MDQEIPDQTSDNQNARSAAGSGGYQQPHDQQQPSGQSPLGMQAGSLFPGSQPTGQSYSEAAGGGWGVPPTGQPPYGVGGYPQGGYTPYQGGYPASYLPGQRTSGVAVASLICSLVFFLWPLTSIAGIILGFVARSQIKKSGGAEKGAGMALAGIIIGFASSVLLIIMGILMAIAIPTFLGVIHSAGDKAAQSDLTTSAINATSYYATSQSFSGYTPSSSYIDYIPGSANSATSATAESNSVAYYLGNNDQSVEFSTYSTSGVCWYILLDSNTSGEDSFNEVSTGTYYYGEDAQAANYCPEHIGKWYSSFTAATHETSPTLP